ncbi:hypothetical protein CC1G_10731 [Coprinopsis cinerea okayama7|uniref:Uncharacterized protein n=1 Tax=Coprinopsis cinerea (strain Okayama-7 / 130 / ATCC MYA-4618 / FGSC 9003) TaxID=240176 RepID=A8P379_COPC7|nr:hypothetical protein CC1G_10731 [Coprinopsis cinerea okayama7\|eukprot:XP_001838489.2 hypothetical protein CC1G_10731 [Coprinopsis cinerea okayama7\
MTHTTYAHASNPDAQIRTRSKQSEESSPPRGLSPVPGKPDTRTPHHRPRPRPQRPRAASFTIAGRSQSSTRGSYGSFTASSPRSELGGAGTSSHFHFHSTTEQGDDDDGMDPSPSSPSYHAYSYTYVPPPPNPNNAPNACTRFILLLTGILLFLFLCVASFRTRYDAQTRFKLDFASQEWYPDRCYAQDRVRDEFGFLGDLDSTGSGGARGGGGGGGGGGRPVAVFGLSGRDSIGRTGDGDSRGKTVDKPRVDEARPEMESLNLTGVRPNDVSLPPGLNLSRPHPDSRLSKGKGRKDVKTPMDLRKPPLIDRSILAKLEKLERKYMSMSSTDSGSGGEFKEGNGETRTEEVRRPPMITAIPEGRPSSSHRHGGEPGSKHSDSKPTPHWSRNSSSPPQSLSNFNITDLCSTTSTSVGSTSTRSPCKFLLPIRIAEQESKARLHFRQIAFLAQRLDRILVLPNVGKSRIGACFKWGFGTYYDVSSEGLRAQAEELSAGGGGGGGHGRLGMVSLEEWKAWAERESERMGKGVDAQLVSFGASLPASITPDAELGDSGESAPGLQIHPYDTELASESQFPWCFHSKFDFLGLRDRSVFATVDIPKEVRMGLRAAPQGELGESVVAALQQTGPSPREDSEDGQSPLSADAPITSDSSPDVLVVNWDLRHPLFHPSGLPHLSYSPALVSLADKLVPNTTRYLAIHWRMETVDPEALKSCAHSLVDVLSDMLHDVRHLAKDVGTVWFASDYPHPLVRDEGTGVTAKSGTFRNFNEHHDEAIAIFRSAFDGGGELAGWRLMDAAGAMREAAFKKEEEALLQDTGVLGIVDKMIAMKATLFVSGSKKCSRQR